MPLEQSERQQPLMDDSEVTLLSGPVLKGSLSEAQPASSVRESWQGLVRALV
jgi:hypothetical protein